MEKNDFILIKDIRSGMKNINVVFIVLEVTASTKTKESREVYSFKVADGTASINCSIWDEPGRLLQPGDIVRMMKCYASMWRGCLTLYSGKTGYGSEISRIGDFCMVFNETHNMSEPQPVTTSQPPIISSNTNGTNGNGRPVVDRQPTLPAGGSSSTSSTSSSGGNEKSKVSSNSRNYISRRPNSLNKK